MARLPRLTLADQPHHVIQRGNDRQDIVRDNADREMLLGVLGENATRFGIALHAYVLMDNHFHLLATPSAADGLPQWMQAVGRRYVRYFNDRHGRTGTLWEGRYKSTLIQTDRYLLACMAYIDLNPVRAGMVVAARDYPWSSHSHYAGLHDDKLLTPHALYWALGNTPFAREAAYAELVQHGLPVGEQVALTQATLHGWAIGDPQYLDELQKATDRRVLKAKAGRPVAVSKRR
ncbi:MAG: transposase [Variovorax sp.]